ncbi:hydrogen peroxide-inducible genes activator [Kiloniella laminariae]|uniref:hydrogen peroxide-inducible genes activator n=1 Tax=Kiloniella laminariae TaxID=454162 RepID=UPI00035F9711|nr:hydrogen peroxide-inducible genes activator [Kiloniella laminariae]
MAKPTIRQLEYFLALAEDLHFRKAAERLHVSQPTLSDQIRELEYRLGVVLLERSRQSVALTPVGQDLVERARYLLRDLDDFCDAAKSASGMLGGKIRLGIAPTIGPYLMPKVIPQLHKRYPDLKLYIREDRSRVLEQALRDGVHDLVMTALPVQDDNLENFLLFKEPLLLGLPRDHPLTSRTEIEPQDLAGESVLSLGAGHRLFEQVQRLCEELGAVVQSDYEGTSLDALRQMVGMGMGVSFFPGLYVRSEITNDDQVVVRPLQSSAAQRQIGLLWRCKSPRSKDCRTFAEDILSAIQQGAFQDFLTS